MSPRRSKEANLVLGASPRVNLLPPEVADRKREGAIRRSIALGVVGALVICAAGYGLASWQSLESTSRLDAARDETVILLGQQNEFAQVRGLAQQKATIDDALVVGASTEVDWKAYHEAIMATLPADMVLESYVVDSSSPIESVAPPTSPTQSARDAVISFTVVTTNLASVDVWLKSIETLPGYIAGTASGIAGDALGTYKASVTMDVSSAAYSNRYAPEGSMATAEPTTEDATTEGEGTN